jgi:hypothetical protein
MTVAVVVGAGLVPGAYAAQAAGTAAAAASAQEPETVVPAGARWLPHQESVYTATSDGFLIGDLSGNDAWVSPDGSRVPMGYPVPPYGYNQGLWGRSNPYSPQQILLEDIRTRVVDKVVVPAGQTWTGGFTRGAILTAQPGDAASSLHLVHAGDGGAVTDTAVDGAPAGAGFSGLLAQAGRLAVVQLTVDGAKHTYLVDYEAATAREIFAGLPAADIGQAVIGGTRVVGYPAARAATAYSVRLDDPAGTVEQTPYPSAVARDDWAPTPVPAGDRILFVRPQPSGSAGLPLLSVPVGGGDAQTLLARTDGSYTVAPDGSVLIVGGGGPEDWAVRRVTAAPGADPVVTAVVPVPADTATVYGLTYSGGRLVYSSDSVYTSPLMKRDVSPGADPAVTTASSMWPAPPTLESCAEATFTRSCRHLQGLGYGTAAFVGSNGEIIAPLASGSYQFAQLGTTATSTITDGSDSFVIADTPSTGKQTVADLEMHYEDNVVLTRPITASAVWGSTLWVPGTTAGTVRPYDLRTLAFGATVKTAATCGTAFKELQADGRWLYWSCGTSAGIHDRQTGKDISVPAGTVGDASLGDGFLVRHDAASGTLQLTDVHSGTAVTSTLASLPVTITADRNVLWSVDKYGGGVAYVDAQQRIHVLPLADLPRSPISPMGSEVGWGADLSPAFSEGDPLWSAQWTFSRPVASWTLTLKNPAGAAVMTRGGTGTADAPLGTRISASWDLKLASGRLAPNGAYKWTLSAVPGDGQGAAYTASGTLTVSGGAQGHDYTGDGTADLLALTTSGRLDTRFGTASGGITPGFTGARWPTSDTFVAAGDLDGDRYNDLLVRDSSGKLWLYPGNAKAAFTPGMPHTAVGTGYQQYNQLIDAGDMNGDGFADLLARDSAGRLWLHAGNGTGGLKTRTLVGSGYQQYTLIASAAGYTEISGHRPAGEIVARDASGVLWAHITDGKGHFTTRIRISSGWNGYNSLTGVEMLAPGGSESLLARDTRGGLWRIDSPENHLTSRIWEGGGWQTYARLF